MRGVLHVGSLVEREFTADEVQLLQLVADRAALAIDHARLFEAERAARQRIENIQVVTDAALAHLEVDELLAVLLPRIRDILRADTCAVLLLDEESNELVARAALGIEEEVEQGVRIPLGARVCGQGRRRRAGRALIEVDDVPACREPDPPPEGDQVDARRAASSSRGGVARRPPCRLAHVEGVHRARRSSCSSSSPCAWPIAIERARLHEETVQLEQFRSNFVAIASHELRTPATSVYGVLKTLAERGTELSEDLREELLRVGVEQGERLRRLLEELLDLSRLDAKAIDVSPRPVALRAALADVVAGALPDGDVELDVPDDLAALIDPLVLERVVTNLLVNAARYGAPPIRIEARLRDLHIRVVVEDSGAGIPPDLEGRIFDRFARGTQSGHGLGLAIARAYAQAHGGDLIYDPRGGGARFELLIPQQMRESTPVATS